MRPVGLDRLVHGITGSFREIYGLLPMDAQPTPIYSQVILLVLGVENGGEQYPEIELLAAAFSPTGPQINPPGIRIEFISLLTR